jgi:hypothetical protein
MAEYLLREQQLGYGLLIFSQQLLGHLVDVNDSIAELQTSVTRQLYVMQPIVSAASMLFVNSTRPGPGDSVAHKAGGKAVRVATFDLEAFTSDRSHVQPLAGCALTYKVPPQSDKSESIGIECLAYNVSDYRVGPHAVSSNDSRWS